jgi:hypothetical protein
MLEDVNEASERLNESSKVFATTADNVSDRIAQSASAMQQASESLDRVAQSPTFFSWLTRTAWPTVKSRTYAMVGKDRKAKKIRRQIPRTSASNGALEQSSSNGRKGNAKADGDRSASEATSQVDQ